MNTPDKAYIMEKEDAKRGCSMIGSISGILIGQTLANRRELHDAGVHKGLQQGIAPDGSSIVLSVGYIDDEDDGDLIIYMGEGGRDANTGSMG